MASLTRGHEFEQGPGVGDGREGWYVTVHVTVQESDMTEQMNRTE